MSPYAKNFTKINSLPFSLKKNKIFSFGILKNTFVLNILFISLLLFFIIFQFILVNRLAIYSFKIKELEEKKRILEQDKKNLELETIKIESAQSVRDYFKNLNLVQTEKLEYLKPIGGTIAGK